MAGQQGRVYQQKTLRRDAFGQPLVNAKGEKQYRVRSKYWWIRYRDASGRIIDESTGKTTRTKAKDILSKRVGAVANGESVAQYRERLTFTDAVQDVVNNQKLKDRASVADTERRIRLHLTPYFRAERLMLNIDSSTVNAYCAHRKDEGAGPATINRELAILRRAFVLAVRAKRLTSAPYIEMLDEPEPRQGFFTRPEFEAVRAFMPAHLRPLLTFYFWTGWRKGEALGLQVRQYDVDTSLLTLDAEQSKNRRSRQIDLSHFDELRDMLKDQVQSAERIGREHDRIVTALFHDPEGRPVTGWRYREAFESARTEAGVPQRMTHDFRRTAVRNLVRAGVPKTVGMKITGHKTGIMFDRYDTTDAEDMREAGAKVSALVTGQAAGKRSGQVRAFRRRAKG
jgi:integrase